MLPIAHCQKFQLIIHSKLDHRNIFIHLTASKLQLSARSLLHNILVKRCAHAFLEEKFYRGNYTYIDACCARAYGRRSSRHACVKIGTGSRDPCNQSASRIEQRNRSWNRARGSCVIARAVCASKRGHQRREERL